MKTPRTITFALSAIPLLALVAPTSGRSGSLSGEVRAAVPISPGEMGQESEASGACPTFSWSPGNGVGTEIAVYELSSAAGDVEPRLVFSRHFPEGASSWSPARADCLAAGGRFAWIVRAAAGEWSEARRFSIPAGPGDDEVATALEVLRRHYEAGGALVQPSGGAATATASHQTAATGRAISSSRAPEGVAGSAAIRGELAGGSGETYGVLGVSNSAAGAGLAASNSANGADLRLDGSAAGATDLALSEAGIDRSSPAAETFNFHNSGVGTMKLQVDGDDVLTASTLDWSGIANIPAGFADGIDDDTLYAAGNQLDLTNGTFGVVEGAGSGLDADTLDSLDSTDFVPATALTWAAVQRKFYLTTATYSGSQPLSTPACEIGYHMASLFEILDPSNLAYNLFLGRTTADAGSGPPTGDRGWIRTGYASSSANTTPGIDNCNVWTVTTGFGTTAYLRLDWDTYTNDNGASESVMKISPWRGEVYSCANPYPVWCVED